MAIINFPSNPSVGDRYAFETKEWEWNGSGWALVPVTAGVTSLNTLTGDVSLQAGPNITVDVLTGNVIQISGEPGGVEAINSMTGLVTLQAGLGMTITPQSGNVLVFSASLAGAVTSLNSMTGDVTLQAGSNITITPQSGNVLSISSTASGGVVSLNGLTDAIVLQGGGGTTVTIESGNVLRITSTGSGGVDDLNGMVGSVTLQAGNNVTITPQSGNVISISATGGSGGVGSTYEDLVLADNPTRLYMLDDASGSTAVDSSVNASNGTYNNSPTLNQTSMMYDGEGAAVLFAGSTQSMTFSGGLNTTLNSAALVIVDAIVNISGTSLNGCFFSVMLDGLNFALGVGSTTFSSSGNNLIALQQGNAYFASGVALGTGNKHVAMAWSKANSQLYLFINGNHVYTANTNSSTYSGADCVGALAASSLAFAGKLQAFSTTYLQNVVNASTVSMSIDIVRRRFQKFSRGIFGGGGAVAGVESLNAMTGDVTLQAGSNITLTAQSGNVISIASTGGGSNEFPGGVAMPAAWWVADDLGEFLVDGASVSAWASRISNQWEPFIASTAPIFKASIVNGHDVVRFDGSTQSMSSQVIRMQSLVASQEMTIIIVAAPDNTSSLLTMVGKTKSAGYEFSFLVPNTSSFVNLWQSGGANYGALVGYASQPSASTFYVNALRAKYGKQISGWRNGGMGNASSAFSGSMSVITDAHFWVGQRGDSSNWFDGDVAEILVYTRALTLAELDAVSTYLADKYNLTVDPIASTADPDFPKVTLLLHCNGTNGSTSFPEASYSGLTATANGNVQISTAQSQFGGASALFDGTGDYLSYSTDAAFGFGTGDFTFEGWIRLTATPGDQGIFDFRTGGTGVPGTFFIDGPAGNKLAFWYGSKLGGTGTALTTGVWYHVALTRASGTFRCYLDGVEEWNSTPASVDFTSSRQLGIGGSSYGSYFNGYIDEVRITKGLARYTAAFTPPSQRFADYGP